jgi:hypothetical protein
MVSKADFEIGDQISFIYNGGSRPGARRILDVKSVEPTCVRGFDHYTKEERAFSYSKMAYEVFLYKTQKKLIVYVDYDDGYYDISLQFQKRSVVLSFEVTGNDSHFYINNSPIQTLDDLKRVVAAL